MNLSSFKSWIRWLIPSKVRRIIRLLLAPYRLRHSWLTRKTTTEDDHLSMYWNADQQPNRKQLISLLKKEAELVLSVKGIPLSILEYGSHVGLNLRLIREALDESQEALLFAVEPNCEAVDFLKVKMPHVNVFLGEDSTFCDAVDFPPQGEYLSFINSVFYSMTPKRVERVLEKLSRFSSTIIIGESIANIDGYSARLHENPECFEHPFRKLLNQFGFEIVAQYDAVDPKPQMNGYLIARKANSMQR